jgi:hypothetical protein
LQEVSLKPTPRSLISKGGSKLSSAKHLGITLKNIFILEVPSQQNFDPKGLITFGIRHPKLSNNDRKKFA